MYEVLVYQFFFLNALSRVGDQVSHLNSVDCKMINPLYYFHLNKRSGGLPFYKITEIVRAI